MPGDFRTRLGHRAVEAGARPSSGVPARTGVVSGPAIGPCRRGPVRTPHARPDDGSASIEAVILFPLVLLLVMVVIQAGVFYHARDVARSAANGGAVAGAVEGGSSAGAEAEARSRIDRAGGSGLLDTSTVTATHDDAQVTVTVEGRAKTFVPGLPPLTVTETVSAPVERFTAP